MVVPPWSSTMQDTRKTKALLHMHEIKIPKVSYPDLLHLIL